MPKTPVRFNSFVHGSPEAYAGTRIGEHTQEVLLGLGYSEAEVENFHKTNTVKSPIK